MPNINQRIEPLGQGGMPRYNRKVNELINTVNWLMGMRSETGIPISEGGRGPIIPSAPASVGGAQPWLTDPDGNAAGWSSITCLNLQKNQAFDVWIWTGQTAKNVRNIPWMIDPSNLLADWVVCAQNTFWGTGSCPVMGGNFQNGVIARSGTNPIIFTANPQSPPIVVPKNPPSCYIETIAWPPEPTGYPDTPPGPWLWIGNSLATGQPSFGFSWTWTLTYDGTQVFSYNGSGTATPNNPTVPYLDPTGWLYDPGGLPGYSQGNKRWVYQYQGPVSTNTNPAVVSTFSYTSPNPVSLPTTFPIVYLTG
jgi:hypothetical protein